MKKGVLLLIVLMRLLCYESIAYPVEKSLNQLLDRCRTSYSEESSEYAECLLWCAHVCAERGDNVQAKYLLEESRIVFSKYGDGVFEGRDTLSFIFSLDLDARIMYNSGQDYRAVRVLEKSSAYKKSLFGENSEQYFKSLLDISQLYAERLNFNRSNFYHNVGYNAYVERIREEFCRICESQRVLYWNEASKYINRTLNIAHKNARHSYRGGDYSLASAAYNAALLSKGLLLNTTVSFENHVYQSGDEESIALLNEKKLLIETDAEQSAIDSMDYAIIEALERSGSKFTLPHLSINWKDVASALSYDDLAIEFYKNSEGKYGAILLKKDWSSPKIVRLKEFVKVNGRYYTLEDALHRITLENHTSEKGMALWELSKTIWSDKIVKYFPRKNDGRVFFSADGELLITGIEYLPALKPDISGTFYCLSDLFSLYRLSSTRELVYEKKPNSNSAASVYGGLRYDMSYDEMVARDGSSDKEVVRSSRGADGIEYLKGTEVEAESVYESLINADSLLLRVKKYIGKDGTETSFKALSNTQQRLIHVASHGYFYSQNDSSFKQFGLGDHPMSRSGLYFAGAENKWFGEELPDGVDDGFLTAWEIANLNFCDLELVVLSACETARGDVESDGVFGLQRGFKMSSAGSILMSLWKVDDEATCLLMTEFYKHWMGGSTKHDALKKAQSVVRSHIDKGWDSPRYWASFILLDAVDALL